MTRDHQATTPEGHDALTAEERVRYLRHLALPEFGETGQRRLKSASVLLVGVGGLGSPAALYLAAAGVGRIGIIDPDVVDASNLQRQVLHGTGSLGQPKVRSAESRLRDLNPPITITGYQERLTEHNARDLIASHDLVIDGSDNFTTRYLINDTCFFLGKPWVYGSIYRFEGQVSVFDSRTGPCYRCLYPAPPPAEAAPDCSQAGVLGVLPGVIGSLQATEAIKLLAGLGQPLIGQVLYYDALTMTVKKLNLHRDPACPLCGRQPSITELRAEAEACRRINKESSPMNDEIDAPTLKAMLESDRPPVLIDVREPWEHQLCAIGQSRLIPLAGLPDRIDEIPEEGTVVLYCRSGGRSRKALDYVSRHRANACHLRGGILAWAAEIDPSIPTY